MTDDASPVNALQRLVLTRLAELGTPGEPMSVREAARRVDGQVSHATLANIASGQHSGNLRPRVAEALASALQVPVVQVYDAAGQPRPEGEWVLPPRFNQLTHRQRQVVEEVADALLAADARGYERAKDEGQSNIRSITKR